MCKVNVSLKNWLYCRRRINTEEKAKVFAAVFGGGTRYAAPLAFSSKEDFQKSVLGEHPIWLGCCLMWCEQMILFPMHPFRHVAVILFIFFFKLSWCKIAIASIPSIKQQRRPLPSLLYLSFMYGSTILDAFTWAAAAWAIPGWPAWLAPAPASGTLASPTQWSRTRASLC